MRRHTAKEWGESEAEARRPCDHSGCCHAGEYRAPKSPHDLNSYFWFCLDHVRAYNAAWDFYKGLSATEIEEMVRCDTTWQRPTWPLGRMGARTHIDFDRIKDPFGMFEDMTAEARRERRAAEARIHTAEDKAMRVMALTHPLTVVILKARYKELVKRHHPDANGGAKAAEERFKDIVEAYQTLLHHLNA